MQYHSYGLRRLLVLLVLLICCGTLGGVAWNIYNLPRRATEVFGSASPALGQLDVYRYAAKLFLNKDRLLMAANPQGDKISFEVQLGESIASLSYRLEQAGVINDGDAFRDYLIYSGLDYRVQAGRYELDPSMNSLEIAQRLLDSTPSEVEFNILPGWRAEEIAASLPTSGLGFSPQSFVAMVYSPQGLPLPEELLDAPSLEGFLFPAVYRLPRDISLEQFLAVLTGEFVKEVTPDMRERYARHGLSLQEAVTLASIVQREAVIAEEQPLIASVFLNRLAVGMRLESDPTVQYALGYNLTQKTWWTNPLALSDLQVDSPYNTYRYPGLPPGAICNPGYSALYAVAYPASTTYYYFRSRCDHSGYHEFAETYEEHLSNACP
ncbi:MAG: endolytic transglycosylase MltG [Anaerolineae bacterium]|nr:endolytic transglycosylase MltG [Anaerolineae bacterium]